MVFFCNACRLQEMRGWETQVDELVGPFVAIRWCSCGGSLNEGAPPNLDRRTRGFFHFFSPLELRHSDHLPHRVEALQACSHGPVSHSKPRYTSFPSVSPPPNVVFWPSSVRAPLAIARNEPDRTNERKQPNRISKRSMHQWVERHPQLWTQIDSSSQQKPFGGHGCPLRWP